jgi:hypothetical protein
MALRYFNLDEVVAAARSALRLRLLTTMAVTLVVAVVIYGVFSIGGPVHGFSSILLRFIGGVGALLWTLFGLTALAHQMAIAHQGGEIPSPLEAANFAWGRILPLLVVPAWGAGLLLALLLAEMLVVLFARIPGIGGIWLAAVAVPLLLLNTLVALGLLLALFNIAVRVAISSPDRDSLKDTLWTLLRTRLPELLIYNLGGVLAACLVAAVVLSPLWLGWQITHGIVGYVAGDTLHAVLGAAGFWGGIAHIVGLVMVGILVAAVASVPCIVITHLTLMIHKELDAASEPAVAEAKTETPEKKAPVRRAARSTTTGGAAKAKGTSAKATKVTEKPAPTRKPRKPRTKKTAESEESAPKGE